LTGKTYVVAHTWGDITRPLSSAEGPVAAFAADGLTAGATVSAGQSVGIESWAGVASASITAGGSWQTGDTASYSAVVTAHGPITGASITASHNVELLSFENIKSNVEAEHGSADVTAIGDITSPSIKAGLTANVSTWGNLGVSPTPEDPGDPNANPPVPPTPADPGQRVGITAGATASVGVHGNSHAKVTPKHAEMGSRLKDVWTL